MTNIQNPQSLYTIFLEQPPSCLEFCPSAPDYLIIGTYLLSESSTTNSTGTQTKTGTIQLFRLDPESFQLTQIHKTLLPHAVFDVHFSPRDPSLFAIATSNASVSLYNLEYSSPQNPHIILHLTTITAHENPSIPSLYLSWLPPSHLTAGNKGKEHSHAHGYSPDQLSTDGFAVSFSDGRVSIFHTNSPSHDFSQDSMTEIVLPGEPVEVWFTAFHYGKSLSGKENLLLFSGDDFGVLRVHEFVADGEGDEKQRPLWAEGQFPAQTTDVSVGGKHHGAGITAILPLFTEGSDTVLLTGSYDEYLRVYKFSGQASVLAEERLGGGVWRLMVITEVENEPLAMEGSSDIRSHSYFVLASCMHAGVRIVRVTCSVGKDTSAAGVWEIETLAQFTEHESMNYASDVWRGGTKVGTQIGKESDSLLCVSSSFYDKRVCVWKVKV
ncbi:conserved hypothetical protein [Histoplasma capsulatum var. duboisii H88]|uniref:WD40 domain-containing protein n=2 Tax=Ajellomyces capsulatus TaxID=5037 RepID=F0UJG0_AJEC8|nr:conserved hypothetical protein [Histoplasma capsulatum H143]EGC45756.1 conserved hypothetical protein [Histoplasma capsulatum var. duboisii H88]QSS56404.1 hypothetical protein I7I53_04604 [Histoplasma capsulatum var. duboisii H88]